MYGTSVANASAIFSCYPASMGIFVTLTGIGAAVAPTAVGLVADLANIRFGFAVLLIAAVLLVIAAKMCIRDSAQHGRVGDRAGDVFLI